MSGRGPVHAPAPDAPPRLGPRPLPVHLGLASANILGAFAAGAHDLGDTDPVALIGARAADAAARFDELLGGIRAYWAHPYRRALEAPPVLWRAGAARLYDYRPGANGGATALFVPSLVNRAYILDLAPGRSLMRHLADNGIRPLLLDWGAPAAAERGFDLSAYIERRLAPALDAAVAAAGGPVALVGYCMGGLLALAPALRAPDKISRLVLLATPWDFHADGALAASAAGAMAEAFGDLLDQWGELPVDLLQSFFAVLQASEITAKFRAFAGLAPDSARAREFVQVEDWLNDGVPLTAPVARECLIGWYGENRPGQGRWRVSGTPVDPSALGVPALVVIPARDRIVPQASAHALARAIPGAQLLAPDTGHIGMVVGRAAPENVWPALVRFLSGAGR